MADGDLQPVSVEDSSGRILSGVGVSESSLKETMTERPADKPSAETPAPPAVAPSPRPETPQAASLEEENDPDSLLQRNPDGTFKKPTRGQKRFAQLTAAREEQERLRMQAESRASELERRLAAMESQRSSAPAVAPPSQPVSVPATRQKPVEDEIGTKYQTYADFAEDLADWKVEQRLAALNFDALVRSGIEADRASRSRQEYVQSFLTRAKAAYPDFDAVLQNAHTVEFPDLSVLVNAPNAEHLVYALAKDPVLAQQIATERDPVRLGYLMASVQPPQMTPPPASSPAPVASTAPAPYQPVGSGSKTTTPSLDELANSGDDYDRSGYRERRAQERKGARR